METAPYYLTRLKAELSQKQRFNPHYSLRAYARDIGIHPATLSLVLKGKRELPLKSLKTTMSNLGLSPKERTLFSESLFGTKTNLDQIKVPNDIEQHMLDESHHQIIAEWEHYAVLALFRLDDFNATPSEIAKRLNITENRVEVVLANLFQCDLIREEDGKLVRTHAQLRTTEDVESEALRKSHLETLEMSKKKLLEVETDLRDFSSLTLAMNLDQIPEVKTIIREFRQKMTALLRDGEKTDVCQLAIQFYPITKKKE